MLSYKIPKSLTIPSPYDQMANFRGACWCFRKTVKITSESILRF